MGHRLFVEAEGVLVGVALKENQRKKTPPVWGCPRSQTCLGSCLTVFDQEAAGLKGTA